MGCSMEVVVSVMCSSRQTGRNEGGNEYRWGNKEWVVWGCLGTLHLAREGDGDSSEQCCTSQPDLRSQESPSPWSCLFFFFL